MRYAIKPVKMQDTHAIRYDIWDLEADEPICQTFNAEEAQRICDELNGISTSDPDTPSTAETRTPPANSESLASDFGTGKSPIDPRAGSASVSCLRLDKVRAARGPEGVGTIPFATRKNEVLLASQANLLTSSPGRDYLKDEECPLASLPHWQQAMALALLGRQKAREWAISRKFGRGIKC